MQDILACQSNLNYSAVKKKHEETQKITRTIIKLQEMCSKWWLEKVQSCLCKKISKAQLFSLHRYICELPRDIRSKILHNGLKSGGLHLSHGSKEIPGVNKSLTFLSSDLIVEESVYLSLNFSNGNQTSYLSSDLDLILRSGEGLKKIVLIQPKIIKECLKKSVSDLFRTCQYITHVTIKNAADTFLVLATRYLTHVKFIDVSDSPEITNDGVFKAVVNLKWKAETPTKLEVFNIGGTSVNSDGVLHILTSLHSIKSLGSIDLIEPIEALNALADSDTFKCDIEETTVFYATVNRIQCLRKHCPNLVSIKIIFQEAASATIADLYLLEGLRHIDIIAREPFLFSPTNLRELLWRFGSKVLTLKVSGDIYWEGDLGMIVGQCPFIEHLSFPSVTIPTKDSLTVLLAKDTLTLKNLSELEINCMNGVGPKAWAKDFNLVRRGLVLALRRCVNLKKFILRPTCLCDIDFFDILAFNAFTKLEVLELYDSILNLEFAKTLIDSCQNLHVLKGVRTWRGMLLHDIIMLRSYTKGHKRAADLKIVP